MVDVLCKQGNHAAAVRLEEWWNAFVRAGISLLCGYAIDDFDDDVSATPLRTICRQHSQVIPAEAVTDAPADRTSSDQIAILQQRARALDRCSPASRLPPKPP